MMWGMKTLLPVFLLVAFAATSQAGAKTVSSQFLLLYPSATIETDFGGRCERIHNISDGIVYLPLLTGKDFNAALRALGPQLHVEDCKPR
jgi:hypothetical protein